MFSATAPREGIVDYNPWLLKLGDEWKSFEVESGRRHGKTVVVKLAGIDDRDQAALLCNAEIAVRREQLPAAKADEIYWADLEGLAVRTVDGVELGRIEHLIETGANDVLVVKGERERLIPFVREQVVKSVDLETGTVTVDWDPEF